MLRMCRYIFVSDKSVLLDSGFFVAKVNTELEAKGVYAAALINKHRYWPKGVPGNLTDANFEDRQVGDVGMIEATNEDNKLFKIFLLNSRIMSCGYWQAELQLISYREQGQKDIS